ncbi:MAG: hypothetical protein AAB897_02515 [Patescibacteria group bacterium]
MGWIFFFLGGTLTGVGMGAHREAENKSGTGWFALAVLSCLFLAGFISYRADIIYRGDLTDFSPGNYAVACQHQSRVLLVRTDVLTTAVLVPAKQFKAKEDAIPQCREFYVGVFTEKGTSGEYTFLKAKPLPPTEKATDRDESKPTLTPENEGLKD